MINKGYSIMELLQEKYVIKGTKIQCKKNNNGSPESISLFNYLSPITKNLYLWKGYVVSYAWLTLSGFI